MKPLFYILILISFIAVILRCTTNPLFNDDKNTYDRHNISGTVTLQDGKIPDGIYVWMEDLNVNTHTNVSGSFSLSLPNTPDFQGLNGAYTIFFYLGNYKYSTATAIVRNGLFEYGERNISGDGKVRDIDPLAELLSISTRVLSTQLTLNQPDSLLIEVSLNKSTSLPVTATFYRDNKNILTGFFIRKIGAPTDETDIFLQQSYRPVTESMGNQTTLRSYLLWNGMRMNPGFATLTEGEYEIFPYIFLEQEGLPPELIFSFGPNAKNISLDYLNIPFIQTIDTFVINANQSIR